MEKKCENCGRYFKVKGEQATLYYCEDCRSE